MTSAAKTILVADDDGAIRTVLNQALTRAGYEVRSTGNAATLWRWAAEGQGDLVVTDVVLPSLNGVELADRLREERPDMSVILMSGFSDHPTVSDQVLAEGRKLLRKPFTQEELAEALNEALGLSVMGFRIIPLSERFTLSI